jgi:hypothetical protein
MPLRRPAGVRCVQLTVDAPCALFGDPRRPAFCAGLQPAEELCSAGPEHALAYLTWLGAATNPAG